MTRRILLADDSVTIQKVVELTFLEHNDVEVVAVGSGNEALERFDDVEPALVIADVHMPGADGFEVCRQVKQRSPSTPVLLLVGTFEPFDQSAVEGSGAQGHLKKPFDSQELARVALELIGAGADEAPTEGESMTEREDAGEAMAGEATDVDEMDAGSAEDAEAATEAAPPEAAAGAAALSGDGELADADVERIARRVVELLSDKAVRDIAWEVVPDLAELLIRDRLRELESQAD